MNNGLTEIVKVRVSPNERELLEQVARLNDRSLSGQARRAINLYLRKSATTMAPAAAERAAP